MTNKMAISTVGDGFWYGALIVAETVALPYRLCECVIDRANKQYQKYKPSRRFTGTY
jgi:hypothetical protein